MSMLDRKAGVSADVISGEARYLVPTYSRPDVVFTHGKGVFLFDTEGRRYLDFCSGIAVNALGCGDPEWVDTLCHQAAKMVHVSNLFHSLPHVELARGLVERSFADRVFFCNSGTEANEAALKFSRKYARWQKKTAEPSKFRKHKTVAFHGGFHGRTLGSLSATYKTKYREPFEPLVPGFVFASYNDLGAAQTAIDDDCCAVIVEPVQGEGGVVPATAGFLQALRRLCDNHQALLVFDEVQCGLGRSGRLWAHETYGVIPDIMTLAKPLAGGLPIGAVLVTERVGQTLEVGDHGSTFAAGPLVCSVAQVVLDRIADLDFLDSVHRKSEHLRSRLSQLQSSRIVDIRGLGLLIGVEFDRPVNPLIELALGKGLILISAGERILRLCPPLIISREEIDTAVSTLAECLDSWEN